MADQRNPRHAHSTPSRKSVGRTAFSTYSSRLRTTKEMNKRAEIPTEPSHRPADSGAWPREEESLSWPAMMKDGRPWPRISIVTLSYNQTEFIEDAIQSVLFQRYPNLEYIIVDGGSSDGSEEVIRRYEDKLAYWSSEPDRGPAAALNKGFQLATGEIFGFLNADDLYLPGSFRKIANRFSTHPSTDVLYGNGLMTDESGRLRMPIFSDLWDLWRMAYGTSVIVQPATFFRKEAFLKTKGFSEELSSCWDAGLWADLAISGATFDLSKDFFGVFRLHNGSITGSGRMRQQSSRDMKVIFEKIMRRRRRVSDRALSLLLRLHKFTRHPRRTLGYKLFLHSIRKGKVTASS
jgi:glycosyltransferase involved in cell wall biosynthesis